MSASQLAVASLVRSGKSEIEALRDLAEWGPEAYAAEIAAEGERVVRILNAKKDADWLETAEGKVDTAERGEEEAAKATRTLTLGKRLLTIEGLSDDDLAMLTDAEIIAASGIEGRADEFGDGSDSMSANLAAMAASTPRGGEAT